MAENSEHLLKFTVNVGPPFSHVLDDITGVYVVGGHAILGEWIPSAAVPLEKTSDDQNTGKSVWTRMVTFPKDEIVNEVQYRYFIGRCAQFISPPVMHVLKWESAVNARQLIVDPTHTQCDEFGNINGRVTVIDGWLSDSRVSEVRFTLFSRSAIQFNEGTKYSTTDAYKVSLQAREQKQGDQEPQMDKWSVLSSAVISDVKRTSYHAKANSTTSTEIYAADGRDMLSFRVQTINLIDHVHFRFSVSNVHTKGISAVADIKPLNRATTQGTVVVPLADSGQGVVVGKLTVSYLLIFPSTSSVVKFSAMQTSFVNYWTTRPSLDIGHRGMGQSYTNCAKERENTVKSMVTAYNNGADYVEFDVQLSKDEIPVLYHDFHICLEDQNKHLRELAFSHLTVDQLNTLNVRHQDDLKKSGKRTMLSVVDRVSESADPTCRAFPTLKDVLIGAPVQLGFNIEVKYPMFLENGNFECEGVLESNSFVDRVLEVLVEHVNGRRILFSSFCPEICVLLKLKQNRYPVLFLTQGITDRYPAYTNPLTKTTQNAIDFALSESLLGVCFHSEDVLRCPSIMEKARKVGLVCFVWGEDLHETKNIEFMRGLGVDGVIYDQIDIHTPGKRNIFQMTTPDPELSKTLAGARVVSSISIPDVDEQRRPVTTKSRPLKKLQPSEKVDNRWEVVKMIGEGGFGSVYEVKDTSYTNSTKILALKIEDANAPPREQVMKMELAILRRMRMKRVTEGKDGKRHFCDLENAGQTPLFRYMVMTLVGKSVSYIKRKCNKKLTGRTVAHVANESLVAIQELHEIGFLHRDIKPSNLAIGIPPQYAELYLIDFGLCRSYRYEDGRLRLPRDTAGFRGTLTYAPLACHQNEDMCRRDDLWSWLYTLIQLSTSKLPWHSTMRKVLSLPFKSQVERIGVVKRDQNANPVSLMSGCAIEFMDLHEHISSLGFYDEPDYEIMLKALKKMETRRRRPDKDGEKLDWEPGGKYYSKINWN